MPARLAVNVLSMETVEATLLAWVGPALVELQTSINAGSLVCSTERRPNEERGGSVGESLRGTVHNFHELFREVDPKTFGVGFSVCVHPCRLVP